MAWGGFKITPGSGSSVSRSNEGGAMINPFDSTQSAFVISKTVEGVVESETNTKCKPVCDTSPNCVGFMHNVTKKQCMIMEARTGVAGSQLAIKTDATKNTYTTYKNASTRIQPTTALQGNNCEATCNQNKDCHGWVQQGARCFALPMLVASPGISTYMK